MAIVQKLEGLVDVLETHKQPQKDVCTLERILQHLCGVSVEKKTPLGLVLMGPQREADVREPFLWTARQVIEIDRRSPCRLNGGLPTVSSLQVSISTLPAQAMRMFKPA